MVGEFSEVMANARRAQCSSAITMHETDLHAPRADERAARRYRRFARES
jgi:hypothetical protein